MSETEQTSPNKNSTKAIFVLFSIAVVAMGATFICLKIGESTAHVKIENEYYAATLGGTGALFFLIFRLLLKSYEKIYKIMLGVVPVMGILVLLSPRMIESPNPSSEGQQRYHENLETACGESACGEGESACGEGECDGGICEEGVCEEDSSVEDI